MDYSSETTNHSQQVTDRIKQSFNWMAEHNIAVRDLPSELTSLVGTTNFTDHTNTNFTCNDRHTECAFFSSKTKPKCDEESNEREPIKVPEAVVYKASEIMQLYKKSQEPVSQGPKISKSSKKKSAKKRQALAKIEAELTRQANVVPLQPGMGRGFCQQRSSSSAGVNRAPADYPSPVNKPCAVICPIKREVTPTSPKQLDKEPVNDMSVPSHLEPDSSLPKLSPLKKSILSEHVRETNRFVEPTKEKCGLPESGRSVGRGRGMSTLSADMLRELGKF